MNAEQFMGLCRKHGACAEGIEWIRGKSLAEFWQTCDRADWMLWICGRMVGEKGWPTRQDIGLVAWLCAETELPVFEKKYPADDRPRKAIEAARLWAKGELGIEEVRKARWADADAAAYAAAYGAAAAAAAAARAGALRKMADIVRGALKVPGAPAATVGKS